MEAQAIPTITPLIESADQWGEILVLLPLLVALEVVLSADNAIALAAISRGLKDPTRQTQALNLGLALALVFRLGLIAAAEAGATAAIQPGGSVRDAEVIAAADERGMAMVFTSIRHFKH